MLRPYATMPQDTVLCMVIMGVCDPDHYVVFPRTLDAARARMDQTDGQTRHILHTIRPGHAMQETTCLILHSSSFHGSRPAELEQLMSSEYLLSLCRAA
jgi:hypothetical protein